MLELDETLCIDFATTFPFKALLTTFVSDTLSGFNLFEYQ